MNRKARARAVLEALRRVIPRPETELRHENPYQLLVAVILSAQCTDERVNRVTPAFFEAFPTLEALAAAEPEDVYPLIRSISYPNNKAKHLVGMARMVRDAFGGEIPRTIPALQRLPGVGRKTAQVVASVAFDSEEALPVDTHVFRVAHRIGLVTDEADTPLKVERQLKRILPRKDWGEAHHLLILHGRYTCTARRPKCEACPVPPHCRYYERLQKLPPPLDGLDPGRGAFFCKTCARYFDAPARHEDRYGVEQIACPACGSMNVFDTKTGRTTKRIKDYRV
ncbi:MAG: endonuclease III [Rhodothermaceae bacterium]|nr:MAG: endonuclease III [Rhodothermaceae bacterium]